MTFINPELNEQINNECYIWDNLMHRNLTVISIKMQTKKKNALAWWNNSGNSRQSTSGRTDQMK